VTDTPEMSSIPVAEKNGHNVHLHQRDDTAVSWLHPSYPGDQRQSPERTFKFLKRTFSKIKPKKNFAIDQLRPYHTVKLTRFYLQFSSFWLLNCRREEHRFLQCLLKKDISTLLPEYNQANQFTSSYCVITCQVFSARFLYLQPLDKIELSALTKNFTQCS
jgi:hypothetical protein